MPHYPWHQMLFSRESVTRVASCCLRRLNGLLTVVCIAACALPGCSTLQDIVEIEEVKPWQRGALARDDMQLNTDNMRQSVDDHVYFSKEASTGGASIQGGGCGCN